MCQTDGHMELIGQFFDALVQLFWQLYDIVFHLDEHLNQWAARLGPWLYVVLTTIIFCETGLVVMPLLPGDSLLFAVGALASIENSALNLPLVALLLCAAAIAGDSVNYAIGYRIGPRIFSRQDSRFLNRQYLTRTQRFYEKHGGKTIIFARFVPIIRTFAPFVAGVGRMNYTRFVIFNITGGVAWVLLFLLAGYFFGNLPGVKRNFHYVILAILVLSVLPAVFEYWKSRKK
ncbi:MAG: DedA family protein [Acidobacteriota bacterium]